MSSIGAITNIERFTPLLSRDEERALAKRVQGGDLEARDHLIRANLGLVVMLARRFKGRGLSLDDLIGEGNVGLVHAVEGFDPDRGTKFSTYAATKIKASISYALQTQRRMVRLPRNFDYSDFPRWYRKANELASILGRTPTAGEIGKALGLSRAKLDTIQHALVIDRPFEQVQPWQVAACQPALMA